MADMGIDEALQRLRRLGQLERRQAALNRRWTRIEAELAELEHTLVRERRDVARLEGFSIAGLAASLSGDKDERLARERVEAESVRLRVHFHRQQLEQIGRELQDVSAELTTLESVRRDYDGVLAPRGDEAVEVADVGRRLVSVELDMREYEEALTSGSHAWQAVQTLLLGLRNTGGAAAANPRFADLLRSGQLGHADRAAWTAEQTLAEFSQQLDDIGVESRVEMPRTDVRWFAGMFFDELLTDAKLYDQIMQTALRVEGIGRWVAGMLEQLTSRHANLVGTAGLLRKRWESLVHGQGPA